MAHEPARCTWPVGYEVGGKLLDALKPIPLGDLTKAEVKSIQTTVDQAGRPLAVVGSAAQGARRGLGTDLPIGKGLHGHSSTIARY